jgi:dolichol-phosphate mannosyltransferase
MAEQRKTISLVLPCYEEEAVFPRLRESLVSLAASMERRYAVEIIFVDDGSHDRTWQLIESFAAVDSRVRGIALSRNFGHQAALTCGYDWAGGDAVISMDADLQDPPEVALTLIEQWERGYDIVYAVRDSRLGETWLKKATAALFYRLIRWMGALHVRQDSGDFRLLSQRTIRVFRQMREQHRFIRGMVGWMGFRSTEVHYQRQARPAGATKYPFRKMVRFALDGVVSFSFFPLRLAYWTGLLLTLANFGYLAYVLVAHFGFGFPLVPGWTSLLLATVGFGTMNLLCLGLAGEYIGRIFEQTKQRPLYLVQQRAGIEQIDLEGSSQTDELPRAASERFER